MPSSVVMKNPPTGMTVSQLITFLQTLPQERIVMVKGYEGGISELKAKNIREGLALCYANDYLGYYGPHDFFDDPIEAIREKQFQLDIHDRNLPVIPCILLDRS